MFVVRKYTNYAEKANVHYPRPCGDEVNGVWGVLALAFQRVHQPLHGGTGGSLIERAVLRGAIGNRFKT